MSPEFEKRIKLMVYFEFVRKYQRLYYASP